MTRILILIKGLGRGGAEQLLVNAAPYLDTSHFEYEVVYLLPWKNALVGELEQAGIPVTCLHGARGVSWMARLHRLVAHRGAKLIHTHSPYPATLIRAGFGIPLVHTEHNVWMRYPTPTYWGNLLTFWRNRHVFAVSEEVRQSIRYPFGLRSLRMPPVETLYHGPDQAAIRGWGSSDGVRQQLGIPGDAPVVGTIANFKAHKGYGYLLRAAVEVRKAIPDVRLVILGVGQLEDQIRRQTSDLGLNGTVVLAGFREDAPRVAKIFDVFTLASLHEGLPIALVEAMSLGKASVLTRVGGIPEVIEHGRHGLLVPPKDPTALADAIIRVLHDRALREQLGGAARLRAAHFDIRNVVGREEEVYRDLTG